MTVDRERLAKVPAQVRPILQAARRTVRAAAPKAEEVAYQSSPPRSKSAMWKIVRYTVDGTPVLGIGVFPSYATVFFYRGRELDAGAGMLEGIGKDARFLRLRSASEAQTATLKRLVRKAVSLGG